MNLRRYQCHKIVRAAKVSTMQTPPAPDPRSSLFTFVGWSLENMDACVEIPQRIVDAVNAHNAESIGSTRPIDLGYFIRYDDGYTSWSTTAAFEKGYTEIFPDGTDTVVEPDGTVRGEPLPNTVAMRRD